MKFDIVDEGLEITAEDSGEAIELLNHMYFFGGRFAEKLLRYASDVQAGKLTLVEKISPSELQRNGRWFFLTYEAPPEFLQPYMDVLKRDVGYEGPIPTLEQAPKYGHRHNKNLCHTHIVTVARISPSGYSVMGYQRAGDWNGKTAEVYARNLFCEYIRRDLGDVRREPEFLTMDNGWRKPNPNYLKVYPAHPAATSCTIYHALLSWWVDNVATPKQREVVETAFACHRTVCKNDTLGEWRLRDHYHGWRTSWDGPLITLEEFKKL